MSTLKTCDLFIPVVVESSMWTSGPCVVGTSKWPPEPGVLETFKWPPDPGGAVAAEATEGEWSRISADIKKCATPVTKFKQYLFFVPSPAL
jgi:hypothetical protein